MYTPRPFVGYYKNKPNALKKELGYRIIITRCMQFSNTICYYESFSLSGNSRNSIRLTEIIKNIYGSIFRLDDLWYSKIL
jgi:hypothetical protein